MVFIYLDDILSLGATPNLVQKHFEIMVKDLLQGGFKINLKKTTLDPKPIVDHLGYSKFTRSFTSDFSSKIKDGKEGVGKIGHQRLHNHH